MENSNKSTFRIGPIRPPSEAHSLLLQVTAGCTWNKCKFCQLYKQSAFKAYSVESMKEDIDVMAEYAKMAMKYKRNDDSWDQREFMEELRTLSRDEMNCYYLVFNWLKHGGENVFLQDGNSLSLKAERLVEVLSYLKSKFPSIKRVTSYGRADTLSKISVDQYKMLKSAGLDRIHSGFESGSDIVLELIHKGVTSEQEIIAGKNIKAAGIELSIYFMPGIGGKAWSIMNALETARVVREINPDFVRIRTSVIGKTTELWEDFLKGNFELCSDNDKLIEIKLLLENVSGCTGILTSDHLVNLLEEVNGSLDKDRERMLKTIDLYLRMPDMEQKKYQLARRSGMVTKLEDMKNLSENQISQLEKISLSIINDEVWELTMNEMMEGFI